MDVERDRSRDLQRIGGPALPTRAAVASEAERHGGFQHECRLRCGGSGRRRNRDAFAVEFNNRIAFRRTERLAEQTNQAQLSASSNQTGEANAQRLVRSLRTPDCQGFVVLHPRGAAEAAENASEIKLTPRKSHLTSTSTVS